MRDWSTLRFLLQAWVSTHICLTLGWMLETAGPTRHLAPGPQAPTASWGQGTDLQLALMESAKCHDAEGRQIEPA